MKTINHFRSKFFALTLALVASVSSFAYNFGSGGLFFNIIDYDNYLAEVTYQKERSEENYDNLTHVIIPDTVLRGRVKYAVVGIGNMAFYKCKTLESIVIPDHISEIKPLAFAGCVKLMDIEIPELPTVVYGLFKECYALERVKLSPNTTEIADFAFEEFRNDYSDNQAHHIY